MSKKTLNRPLPLLFGTGGVPNSAKTRSTVDGIKRIKEIGLDAMEMEFVRGVKMGETSARQVSGVREQAGVKLSAHGPYYINLNAREAAKIAGSQEMLLQTARIANICGADSIVFHPAYYMGDSLEKTYGTVRKYLIEVLKQLRKENNRVCVRPEVMGKGSEFGTVEDTLRLSAEIEGVMPAIDVAHWHARGGKFNTYPEFVSMLDQVEEYLGRPGLENMHIHFSGIRFGQKGELGHLNLKESDFQYVELLKALKDKGARGIVICESPNLEQDALLLKETYAALISAG